MIRLLLRICKNLGADDVDRLALMEPDIDAAKLFCPKCKAIGQMVRHDEYRRHFVFMDGDRVTERLITVVRVRCDSCGSTHALLPLAAIPYKPFSIRFVASFIVDSLEHKFASIEALCSHYRIAVATFYRYRDCFESCVRVVRGVTHKKDHVRAMAAKMLGATSEIDAVLTAFLDTTGLSFCQSRAP